MNIDSEIRKYFVAALSGQYSVYNNLQGINKDNNCYIITQQNRTIDEANKCGYAYDCAIEIECIDRKGVSSNAVNGLILEQMESFVETAYHYLNLPNFVISNKTYNVNYITAEIAADNNKRAIILINFKIGNYE